MDRCIEAYGGQFDPQQCTTNTWPAAEHCSAEKQVGSSAVPKKSNSRRNAWGNMSYADLITKAILSSAEKRLTLAQIYEWMVRNVPYFKDKGDNNSSAGWKNSIRHNLSLHNRFMRVQNEGTGKSSWWMINPDAKPGKSPRRRTTVTNNKPEKKRGRLKKKTPELQRRNSAVPTPSPSSSTSSTSADSPIHPGYQMCSNYRAITSATSQFTPVVDQNGPPFAVYSPNQELVCNMPEPMKPYFADCAPADVSGQGYPQMEPYGHYPTPPRGSPHFMYDNPASYVQPCYPLYSSSQQQYCTTLSNSQHTTLSSSQHPSLSTTLGTSLSTTAGQVVSHLTSLFSPTDTDLNGVAVQGGLECDVDQVLTHELSFGDVLDFGGEASSSILPLQCQYPCVH